VSEVNLDDLRDVRVQLSGEDAAVEVRLGREDFAKRFRQALEVLDAQRATPRGPYVTYVDVSQGKRAVVGTGSTAQYQPGEGTAPEATQTTAAPQHDPAAQGQARPAAKEGRKTAARRGTTKPEVKKAEAQHPAAAVRPRRVG
jgi:hypothetical protein